MLAVAWPQPEMVLLAVAWPQPEMVLLAVMVRVLPAAGEQPRQAAVMLAPALQVVAEQPQWPSRSWRRSAHRRRSGDGSLGTPSRQILSLSLMFDKRRTKIDLGSVL